MNSVAVEIPKLKIFDIPPEGLWSKDAFHYEFIMTVVKQFDEKLSLLVKWVLIHKK